MAPTFLYLPNGHSLAVTPIFGGLYFKSNELSQHHEVSPFPPGWTVVINTVDGGEVQDDSPVLATSERDHQKHSKRIIHAYHVNKPSLRHDHLFISSISQPPSSEFRPPSSQARQIAMMLWATLYWYFQQPEPQPFLITKQSEATPDAGKPKADWRIGISREGVFKSRVVLPKLERMGLIASEDSCVGSDRDERVGEGWLDMFVSRRVFWQIDPRIYLFTLSPIGGSPYPGTTPIHSRPGSPNRLSDDRVETLPRTMVQSGLSSMQSGNQSPTPFSSSSHLPTYYPPPPPQYIYTAGIRHPLRPKPGRQGEIVYTRYIPSFGQYLSFRIASNAAKASAYQGLTSNASLTSSAKLILTDSAVPTLGGLHLEGTDVDYLHRWMNDKRVSEFWGSHGPREVQEMLLRNALNSKHSVPLIGCWDGKPFGFFELYWVKEDQLGRLLGDVGSYDRGIHCLVGEQEFRGAERVKVWLSSLVHYCWMSDNRTEVVMMEPRVDNDKLLNYALQAGFYKEKEIAFPHKQSNLLKIRRDGWEAPAL